MAIHGKRRGKLDRSEGKMLTSMVSVSVPSSCHISEQSTTGQQPLAPWIPLEQRMLFRDIQCSVSCIFTLLTLNLHAPRPTTILQLSLYVFPSCFQRKIGFRFVRDRLTPASYGKKPYKNSKEIPYGQVKGSIMHLPCSNVLLDGS